MKKAGELYQITSLNFSEEFPIKLWEVYSDAQLHDRIADTTGGIMPGTEKYINCFMSEYVGALKNSVLIHGPVYVSLVCNRSGSTLAQGALTAWYTVSLTTTANAKGSAEYVSISSPTFLENEQIGDFMVLESGANVGECRQIVSSKSNLFRVQPRFGAVIGTGITGEVFSCSNIVASSNGLYPYRIAGVVASPNGIPDNYWGWVVSKGRVSGLYAGGSAQSVGRSIKPVGGVVDYASVGDEAYIIGVSLNEPAVVPVANYLAPMIIDVRSGQKGIAI